MKVGASPCFVKRLVTASFVWVALAAVSLAQAPYLAVNGANHDYLTLHYYINEPGDSETLTVEFWPNEGNVAEAQIWSNLNRRDLATLDDQDATSVPGPLPASTGYFVGYPLTSVGGGKWSATFPINKTGAYRITARYRLNGQSTWKWVGGRDTAVMVSPKKARDVVLYELQVNAINATGDTEGTRSTFEDFTNASKPANLDHFVSLGVNTLWIQPIHPIGNHACIDKSQGPGSPYSIQNMWEVAPHMSVGNTRAASMTAFENFASAAKARGIDFFFDIIFNHTSWDAEIGRDPNNPTVPAANPTAQIRNILPQWYSRFTGSSFPCDEYGYNQSDFQFTLPAQNSSQIGPAPAERNDFGKWPDVADLFWGDYPALSNVTTTDDTWWNVNQVGADVKRMVEYFAHFGHYWIEKSGGTLGGFRCDYAQGLPPQAWEYFVNKTRQVKWDFIFMAESLDGGPVSQRAGRHMDIINQNWVWQVLDNGGNTAGLRGVIDANKTDYGFAGIMRGLVNHDQNAPADKWYTFSRYAVGAVIDGAPQLYQGQELGYTDNWGFSRFRFQFGRWIPDIFKWHNMQPLWSNRDWVLQDAYSRVNRGRMRSIATRLHDQFYLNPVGQDNPDPNIFSVMKYERFGDDPANQNVVLSFVNLTPWTQRAATFNLAQPNTAGAVPLNPSRLYNIRSLTSDNPDQQLWEGGRTGQQLINEGIWINFPSDGITHPEWAFVQMLVLEEHGAGPSEPYVTWEPENPEGCGRVTIRYYKENSPLGAGPVQIFIGRNDWNNIQDPWPQMANNGDHWVYYHDVLPGTTELNFVFTNGSGTWDNNNEQDWRVVVSGCEGSTDGTAWTDPAEPDGCDPITVYYDPAGGPLASAGQVYIHIGYNFWNEVIDPNPPMSLSGGVWSYTYDPPAGTEEINFVFNNGSGTWDNNNELDWRVLVTNCEGGTQPSGLVITNPAASIVVSNHVDSYTLAGLAENLTGSIAWSNELTGAHGTLAATASWTLPTILLAVGDNKINVSGTTAATPILVTNAADRASNYSGGWASGSNAGTGFGAWTLFANESAGHFVGADGWGLWSQAGNLSEARRPFSSPLTAGQTFRATWKNGWVNEDPMQGVGLALRNAGGDPLIQFYFNGGDTQYQVEDAAAPRNSGVEWTDSPQTITVEILTATTYRLTVGSTVVNGTYSGTLAEVRFWNWSGGEGSTYDFFIDNLLVTSAGTAPGQPASDSVTIRRLDLDATDSNGDGVPDWWYNLYGYNPGIPNLGKTVAPNGYTFEVSYWMDLNPDESSIPPFKVQSMGVGAGSVTVTAPAGLEIHVDVREDSEAEWGHATTVQLGSEETSATVSLPPNPSGTTRQIRARWTSSVPE